MIARLFCWVMGLCPKHWIPKGYFLGAPHSEDPDYLCPICVKIEDGHYPKGFDKTENSQ